MIKSITLVKIENGFIVQSPPIGCPPDCKIEYAKDLDSMFAIVERLFGELDQKEEKGDG